MLVGNPQAESRTRWIAETLAARLLGPEMYNLTSIDLADYADDVLRGPPPEMSDLCEQAVASDLLVVASPTYRAASTGLLKAFLDRYPANGLKGVISVPVMTGADRAHSMAPDTHLTPLLLELGAIVPVRGYYFVTGEMDRIESALDRAARDGAGVLARLRAFGDDLGRGKNEARKASA